MIDRMKLAPILEDENLVRQIPCDVRGLFIVCIGGKWDFSSLKAILPRDVEDFASWFELRVAQSRL